MPDALEPRAGHRVESAVRPGMSGIYIPGITLMIALLIALMIAHAGEIVRSD